MAVRPAIPSGHAPAADAQGTFASDVQYYLSQEPRQLPSRYLYDPLGSCLFEAICRLPWYRIMRAEGDLLAAHRREVFAAAEPLGRIIELGPGSGEKLAALVSGRAPSAGSRSNPLELHLVDVSAAALTQAERTLSVLDGVRVICHEATYEAGLSELREADPVRGRTLLLFLGSNIGNFDPPGASEFLRETRTALRAGDLFLMGADLVKPEADLQLAYDDPLGVTAAFNRNLLVRINRELGGDFNLDAFVHRAVWNAAHARVEMHLVSLRRQVVRVAAAGIELTLDKDESIWTESSYKYQPDAIAALLRQAGFTPAQQWIDADAGFALTLAKAT